MPVIVKLEVSSEDNFQEMMVLQNNAAEAQQIIDNFLEENDLEEFEIAASQMVHVGDSITSDDFTIIETDEATAQYVISIFGDNFGTGILSEIF